MLKNTSLFVPGERTWESFKLANLSMRSKSTAEYDSLRRMVNSRNVSFETL